MCPVVHMGKDHARDACSGKCQGHCARSAGHRWVIAACDGMIAVLQDNEGQLSPLQQGGANVSSSISDFLEMLEDALVYNKFGQLVVIGSPNDIAWIQSALPQEAAKRIVAEIRYPLVPAWMQQLPNLTHLSRAVEQVLRA